MFVKLELASLMNFSAIIAFAFSLWLNIQLSGQVLHFENMDEESSLPAGLSAQGSTYQIQEGDILFITHLSNQWDHSSASRTEAMRIVSLIRAMHLYRIIHLRGLTPTWQRAEILGMSAGSIQEYYFVNPPQSEYFSQRLVHYFAEANERRDAWIFRKRYPDPYLMDSQVPFPYQWELSFERGVFSEGGGCFYPESKSILVFDPRYQRYFSRSINIPAGVTKLLIIGGWFHACLTRTIKDIVLDTMVEEGTSSVDIILPSKAIFVNMPGKEGRTITLAESMENLSHSERETFFVERLQSIQHYLSNKAGVNIPVEFIHCRRSYRHPNAKGRPLVRLWVVDQVIS